jgi:serine/threonine protein kinase
LKRFNHPNILKAYDFYQKKIEQTEVFIMVVEYIDAGPIINQLENMAGNVREIDVVSLISSVL